MSGPPLQYAFPPVLLVMARDRRLRPGDIQVLVVMAQYLDYLTYRPIKLAALQYELRMSRKYLSQAIRRLVTYGYLDRGVRVTEADGSVREYTFRLVHSLPPSGRVSPRAPSPALDPSPPAA